ncbi:MAG: 50S ribosomal protein L37e [Candidatus Aenigmatarchaeota archaeon]|nr:MAG: 50S ribosomal protein L37e [Candidatus Aenigmarchaeota archaeon]
MSKGTPSFGKHQRRTHVRCRRCGRKSFHKRKGYCAACGFGKTTHIKNENWKTRKITGERKL